jgi:hypothetical protein
MDAVFALEVLDKTPMSPSVSLDQMARPMVFPFHRLAQTIRHSTSIVL